MQGDELKSKLKGGLDAVAAAAVKGSGGDTTWWQDDKLGLFIHWGLYSVLGHGEWAMNNEKIPADKYALFTEKFTASAYDPNAWMSLAKAAGLRYAVMTARHHDGFALWDSPGSWGNFDAPHSAAKRDLVKPYVDAVRKAGLRVGIYYSPMDWRFPGYFKPKELPENAALMKAQAYAQIEELATRYGKLDILWYDGGWLAHQGTDADAAWFWEPDKLNAMLRKYQPTILISPRSGSVGDFQTDEGAGVPKGPTREFAWEKCFSLYEWSWGYNPASPVMSLPKLIEVFIQTLVRGGNTLINVSPDPEGRIPEEQAERLKEFGAWVKPRARAIYGTRPGPWQPQDGKFGSTHSGSKAYLFVTAWPEAGAPLQLPALPQMPTSVRILPKGKAELAHAGGTWKLSVALALRDTYATIIEFDLKREIK